MAFRHAISLSRSAARSVRVLARFNEASATSRTFHLARQFSATAHPLAPFEDVFGAACASRELPGVAMLAANQTGTLRYSKAFGFRSPRDDKAKEPLDVDSPMYIASCTKLITSIAAMQCVERGWIALDDDVRPFVHELQDVDVVTKSNNSQGFSSHKNEAPITLRHLLTHTAGFCYEWNEPLLQAWRRQQPEHRREPGTSLRGRFLHPLIYEPGTSWSYGPSVDWAGVLIERLSGLNLESYMRRHIWEPLGIKSMTFFLSTRPDMRSRAVHMSYRETKGEQPGTTSPVKYAEKQPVLDPDVEDCLGGGGIYAAPSDYLKVLQALLAAASPLATDAPSVPPAQLLRRSSAEAIFQPQLSEPSRNAMYGVCRMPGLSMIMGGGPTTTRKDWGLGGILVMEDLPSWRRRGTMSWYGWPNLYWWIDRSAGLCGFYASQLMPLADPKSAEMIELFEKEMYARLGS
ncbi:beta-lactamase/transpeptidase-like protein [Xylaria arbuscula]|nr:beta-lactamase/transpeptidase-like protein [Xylaria arbuscula]